MNILLTGSSGFIGRSLFIKLGHYKKYNKVISLSKGNGKANENTHYFQSFCGETDFSKALVGVDFIIHLAAVAHVKSFKSRDMYNELKAVNVEATLQLARQASNAGVKRFIFLSSIGVNGTSNDVPFKVSDKSNPTEAYAASKFQAEVGLKKIAEDTGMEVVIIRPPLVYGKEAPGNFGTLLKVAEKNLPLPLGAINNQRSFVAIDNLVDLIVTCIDHPSAANQTFLVSDDENVSTSNLLKKLTLAAGKKPRLIPVPVSLLKFAAKIFGKKSAVERFSSSLTVDIEHTKNTLNWKPPITLDEGIRRCFK